jgi:hypothetical protein
MYSLGRIERFGFAPFSTMILALHSIARLNQKNIPPDDFNKKSEMVPVTKKAESKIRNKGIDFEICCN